jgi:NAD(P)-dependent dehydrogenase (short-subunit alcohol dehydrogenase family)
VKRAKKAGEKKMGRSVFITGAGRGLGLSLARLFLDKGYTVFAGEHRETQLLEELAAEGNPRLHRVNIEVTDSGAVERAARTTGSVADSGLDLLINNAAVCESEDGTIDDLDFRKAAEIIDVNAFGPLRVTKAFLPLLRRGTMKTIVNISSEAGSIQDCWRTGMFGYSMSKSALNMQSKLLDNFLKGDGFRVLCIHPGWMRTDMGGKNADIDPNEAAQGIFGIVSDRKKQTALYGDYKGNRLNF